MNLENPYLRDALGRLEDGRRGEALAACREGLADHPDDGSLWEVYGTILWQEQRWDEARQALETASCLTPLSALAQLGLAEVYVRDRSREAAKAILRHLARSSSCPIHLLARVAAGLGAVEDFRSALYACRRLARARPRLATAPFGIAFYMVRLGRPLDLALPFLERAHALDPSESSYRSNLAAVYSQLGRHRESHALVRTIQIDEISCPAWIRAILPALEGVGDRDRVAAFREKLAALERASRHADDTEETLAD